jgi:CheY-like chemotaxis protein/HPt (histidine-containing phosphotransfer) domain-containing protein
MMDGEIWVTSEVGVGSSFFFVLNFKIAEEAEQTPAKDNSYESKKNYKILIAEDDMINQTYLSRMLTKKGHHVTVTNNGLEAFHDLILMDIQMPEMDGVEALENIRSYEHERGHIPVIALTAFALLGDRDKFISLGMDEYIAKPVKIDELLMIMDKTILSQSSDFGYNERPVINKNGELEFMLSNVVKSREELKPVLSQTDELFLQLNHLISADDYDNIEDMVHFIKELFDKIDAQELKDIAFKIELSARKGNYSDIQFNYDLLKKTYDTMKKSWEL